MLRYVLVLALAVNFISCGDDDEPVTNPPLYSITVMQPTEEDKKVGESIHVHVNFDEASGGTIHHANVMIYEKDNESNVLFDGPSTAHVHDETGHYELHADVTLDSTNNVVGHTDWILKAKAWGHEAGMAETEKTIEFHVHPE